MPPSNAQTDALLEEKAKYDFTFSPKRAPVWGITGGHRRSLGGKSKVSHIFPQEGASLGITGGHWRPLRGKSKVSHIFPPRER